MSGTSTFLERLRERAGAARCRILLPEGEDPRVQEAAVRLQREKLARPVLMGAPAGLQVELRDRFGEGDLPEVMGDPPGELLGRLRDESVARRGGKLSPAEASERLRDPLQQACALVGAGHADGALAGAVRSTPEVIRAALLGVGLAPGLATVSSSFYMDVASFRGLGPEVLTFTDAGVVPSPTPEQLADIALAACQARPRVVGDSPRVAFLSYSTLGSAAGPAVEHVRQAVECFRTLAPAIPAEGELQADAALMPAVAARKAPGSTVAGAANVLVFPDLDAGNIAYKLVQRLAGATALGPILQGLARPVNDLSRGASVEDIVWGACITALLAVEPA